MSAKLYHFPLKTFKGLKIPLYSEEEVFITLICLNCFGSFTVRITEKDLEEIDPVEIMKCLFEGKTADIFSLKTRQVITNILKSIEAK